MKNKHYTKLELDKILGLLSQHAASDACRELIGGLAPATDAARVRESLDKTADAFRLSAKIGSPRFANIKDPGDSLKRAEQGGSLSFRELLDIAAVLREIAILHAWSRETNEHNALSYLLEQLLPDKALLERIETAIISEDEMADSASEELFRVRREMNKQGLLIRERLDKLIRGEDTKKYLQESIVTQRDGRFVIP
ncbi:MAG: endonuclease MutS2, partial [Oscillospiraceae bacterium]|nr:endonuclease MutS2 [Oscillospiraceae bacterium]